LARCSLVELQRLNVELEKRNKDKDQEVKRLKTTLENSGADEVAGLRKELLAVQESANDVGDSTCL